MPSGNKALISIHSWGMGVDLYVAETVLTEGLCGSFDRNITNELKYADSNRFVALSALQRSNNVVPTDFTDSWR